MSTLKNLLFLDNLYHHFLIKALKFFLEYPGWHDTSAHAGASDVLRQSDFLTRLKTPFREFSSYKIYGAIAGIEIDQGVDRFAYKKGLFVIKPSGDTVTIVNDDRFRPKAW